MLNKMYYQYILPVVKAGLLFILGHTNVPYCRCRPWEPCWPTEEEWAAFNTSIDGGLVRLKPVGYVCHEPTFNCSACDDILTQSRDSLWRASQPGNSPRSRITLRRSGSATNKLSEGTLQNWVWESGSFPNETCMVGTSARGSLCYQGRIPLYSAIVLSTQHVQKAIIFAKERNLRLVIKNTGHDTSGRSSSPNSFQIYTHLLKGLQYHANFQPQGAQTSYGPALSIDAGEMQLEVYQKGAWEGFNVVGGDCPSVAAVGGFLQGGGVSSFHSHSRGLAVDNVLQYQVVTASVWTPLTLISLNSRLTLKFRENS
jgi:hypothetical protein